MDGVMSSVLTREPEQNQGSLPCSDSNSPNEDLIARSLDAIFRSQVLISAFEDSISICRETLSQNTDWASKDKNSSTQKQDF